MFDPNIITPFGNVSKDMIGEADKVTKEYLEDQIGAAEMFFQDEIEITFNDIDPKIKDGLFELISENKFTFPERVLALIDITGESIKNITETAWAKGNNFDISGGDEDSSWLVYKEDEADEETVKYIESSLDDIGMFELFPDHLIDSIILEDDLFDGDWFGEYQVEDSENYADEIENESEIDEPEEDEYLNRLHEELCSEGIMEEPEYPEFEEDDEESKQIYLDYLDKLQNEIKSKKDDYVKKRIDDYDSPIEWYRDSFGDSELKELVKNYNLANNARIAQWVFDHDYTSRGNELAGYDGNELEASGIYKGKNYYFLLYRTD